MTRIGGSFLYDCHCLTSLDFSGWSKVTVIGSHFLYYCNFLTTLDISGWNNVTHVGKYFLTNCTSLAKLNLSGWSSVTRVETGFLKGCRIRADSINVTGSSSVVSKYVSRYIRDTKDEARATCQCVCM